MAYIVSGGALNFTHSLTHFGNSMILMFSLVFIVQLINYHTSLFYQYRSFKHSNWWRPMFSSCKNIAYQFKA